MRSQPDPSAFAFTDDPAPRRRRRRRGGGFLWTLCFLVTLVVIMALAAVLVMAGPDDGPRVTASAAGACLVLSFYVLARCHEKTLPPD